MHIPWIRGKVAAQAHVGIPEGTVEEEYARDGFFGAYAHLYRRTSPVAWTRIEGPLRPRAYDTRRIDMRSGDPGDWLAVRTELFENEDARVLLATLEAPTPWFFRNADADELLFVHAGAGRIETDFGPIGIMLERAMPANALAFAHLRLCKPKFLVIPGKGFMFVEPLAKTGSSEKYQLYGEVGLEYGDEVCHAKITGLG